VFLKIRYPIKPHDPTDPDSPPPFEPAISLYPETTAHPPPPPPPTQQTSLITTLTTGNYWGYKFIVVGKYTVDHMKKFISTHYDDVMKAIG